MKLKAKHKRGYVKGAKVVMQKDHFRSPLSSRLHHAMIINGW